MTRAAQLPIEFDYTGTAPTGFEGIKRTSCTHTKLFEKVTVTLTDGTPSIATREVLPPGEYEREITVASVDGDILVISDQPGVFTTVKALEPGI